MCRGVSHTPITAADKPKPFPISPNISAKMCRGVSHTPSQQREYINHWSGLAIFVACSLTSGRMRYAPTLVRLIVGRGGDFRCAFAHVRAYAIRPYSFWRNLWRASNNGERYFLPEFFYASSYWYVLPAKNFGSSYRYFLMLQFASARHTGTF